jgi:hypothetical protein
MKDIQKRQDGKVFLETTIVTSYLDKAPEIPEFVVQSIASYYLQHDMVLSLTTSHCYLFYIFTFYVNDILLQIFLPINFNNMHWYLAVVNARQLSIQVLDSFGKINYTRTHIPKIISCCYIPKMSNFRCYSP